MQLGKVYALQADYQAAVTVCLEALQYSPDNAEVLTTIGLLYLRMGENYKAFDFLGKSLSNSPRSVKTILAAASVIQANPAPCSHAITINRTHCMLLIV